VRRRVSPHPVHRWSKFRFFASQRPFVFSVCKPMFWFLYLPGTPSPVQLSECAEGADRFIPSYSACIGTQLSRKVRGDPPSSADPRGGDKLFRVFQTPRRESYLRTSPPLFSSRRADSPFSLLYGIRSPFLAPGVHRVRADPYPAG